jgi:hypothetical protein
MYFEIPLTSSLANFSYGITENIFITNCTAEETPSSDTISPAL